MCWCAGVGAIIITGNYGPSLTLSIIDLNTFTRDVNGVQRFKFLPLITVCGDGGWGLYRVRGVA